MLGISEGLGLHLPFNIFQRLLQEASAKPDRITSPVGRLSKGFGNFPGMVVHFGCFTPIEYIIHIDT